ncbi:MAG: ComF family protein [Elusimicrobiota bacterium]
MGFWSQAALHVLLPRACAHCRADLPFGDAEPLCEACRQAMPPPADPACRRCDGRLGSRRDLCRSCTGRLFACRLIRAATAHRGPAVSLVHAFKFRGLPSAARAAGAVMAREMLARRGLSGFDALVPVPLHPERERRRGYNQAEILSREIGAATGLPILSLLERRGWGAPSWRLGRIERRTALSGAFTFRSGCEKSAEGKRLLLIDDVCATGTTLEECARALRKAGADDVAGWVFARAGSI